MSLVCSGVYANTEAAASNEGLTEDSFKVAEEMIQSTYNVAKADETDYSKIYPCPFGWSVKPNPSVDNSLSYTSADSSLVISVTSLAKTHGSYATPEAYARVASEQMNCKLPSRSNLIENAWTFDCPDYNVETVVYGEPDNLAMLVIAGRNFETEKKLEDFVQFLNSQAD